MGFYSPIQFSKDPAAPYIEQLLESRQPVASKPDLHTTMNFERQMLGYIKSGDSDGLMELFAKGTAVQDDKGLY